jgi:hypothetical protein
MIEITFKYETNLWNICAKIADEFYKLNTLTRVYLYNSLEKNAIVLVLDGEVEPYDYQLSINENIHRGLDREQLIQWLYIRLVRVPLYWED